MGKAEWILAAALFIWALGFGFSMYKIAKINVDYAKVCRDLGGLPSTGIYSSNTCAFPGK